MAPTRFFAAVLFVVLVGPARAQSDHEWQGEQCDLKAGHFLVTSAVVHLKAAVETRFEDVRAKRLEDAQRVLVQALTTTGQSENPAAWYYLGRYYLLRGDIVGADSALTRATVLHPACAEDVAGWRRYYWVPTLNAGIAAWQAGDVDSAVASFIRANTLYRGEPQGLLYLAQLHAGRDLADSAIKYYRLGIEVAGSDTAFADQKKQAMFNLARMYHREQQWEQAATTYRDYLRRYPNDAEATAALAAVYTQWGKPDSATTLYRAVLNRADSAHFLDLMQAGVQMYRSGAQAEGTDAIETYRLSARAFEGALKQNRFYRDALYNLANVLYQLKDTVGMLPVARRLVGVDPLNRGALQVLAQAFQLAGQGDSSLYYLRRSNDRLPLDVTVSSVQLGDGNVSVAGIATNFHSAKSNAIQVLFEFLTAQGEIVATATTTIPPLKAQGTHSFTVEGAGAGIVAYRYRPLP
jgi:tetratricopeptide (TPR) repeat protein